MLTYEDCVALCELTPEEIEAIAEHEHIPEMVALEMGNYLVQTEDGEPCIRDYILDDIRHCKDSGNSERVELLMDVIRNFIASHPRAERRSGDR